jgi:hypothetical protein
MLLYVRAEAEVLWNMGGARIYNLGVQSIIFFLGIYLAKMLNDTT